MLETTTEKTSEEIEIREALLNLRKLENALKQVSSKIAATLTRTWNELLDQQLNSQKIDHNFKALEDLTQEINEIYPALLALQSRTQAGLINIENNETAKSAGDNLPDMLESFINEASELKMHLYTAKEALYKIACPARIVRKRIAKILKIPRRGIDDLIFPQTQTQTPLDEESEYGVGF